ncbi:MAG: Crp/Fnr family transcriptional regulator [Thermoanaerobaculia bacterium]
MSGVTAGGAADSGLFCGLTPDQRSEVLGAARQRRLGQDDCLFLQGDPVEALYVVDSGQVKLVQHTADGEEVIVRTVGPGGIIAGVALLDKRTLPVTAAALTPATLLLWPRASIQELAVRYPVLRANVLATIADRMQESLSRIRELSSETAAQRIARSLLRLARERGRPDADGILIEQKLGRQQIADLAGSSMFTASRLLAAWSREGIVRASRQRVVILSLQRLQAIAESPPAER